MTNIVTICADIGSVKTQKFGWWSSQNVDKEVARDHLSTLASHVRDMLDSGAPVALGFECPLFVPLREDEFQLTNARPGERNRPWSAGAGCAVLTTGLVQVAWVLREIRRGLALPVRSFLSWDSFIEEGCGLFIWESFVSGSAKGFSHTDDAELGGTAFVKTLPNPTKSNAVGCDSSVYSLIGAALLLTNWSADIRLLQEPCLVIKTE